MPTSSSPHARRRRAISPGSAVALRTRLAPSQSTCPLRMRCSVSWGRTAATCSRTSPTRTCPHSGQSARGSARVRASRITYVGELGYELYIPTEFAQSVYDMIVSAGSSFGLRLAGYHALNSLRMEKAYRHWGHDISDEDTPLEAGLQFAIAREQPRGLRRR